MGDRPADSLLARVSDAEFRPGLKESGDPEVTRSMGLGIWKRSKHICKFKCEDPREAAAGLNHVIIHSKTFRITGFMQRMQVRVGLMRVRQATKIKNECENE